MPGPMADWVRPVGAEVLRRPVVVSPHFDDAVLGCGQLLAGHPGATVVTVMGGQRLAGWDRLTPWDALGGFRPGDDVVAARPDVGEVADALWGQLVDLAPTAVFVPLGLANPDHMLTHDAAVSLARGRVAESYWRLAPPPPGWEGLWSND
ncbi:MAG: hypothetical protein ACYDB7_14230 [Mycobacteriales bacterium]